MRKPSPKKSRSAKKTAKKPARSVKKIARKITARIVRKSFKKLKIQKFIPVVSQIFKDPVKDPIPNSQGFQFPERYGNDDLVLLVRDPWWIYAYWEVTPQRDHEILGLIEKDGLFDPCKVLRVYDVTDKNPPDHHSFFDIEVSFAGNWYVDVGKPDRQWFAEIGFRTREGRFFALVRSNVVRTPRFGVSDVLDEEWLLPDDIYWKIFGLSGGVGSQKSSLSVKEILERYLRGLGASENSPALSPASKSQNKDAQFTFSPAAVLEKQ